MVRGVSRDWRLVHGKLCETIGRRSRPRILPIHTIASGCAGRRGRHDRSGGIIIAARISVVGATTSELGVDAGSRAMQWL